ncbi:MAG: MFS transporter [Spirochaetales bacterium]|jgi:MFS family permease|nr:MFS transporter [Spirochaetales bacterium]
MGTQAKFYGWKLVLVVWLQYFLNMGLGLYGSSVIGSVMLSEGAMTRNIHGITFTLLVLFMGGIAIFVSLVVSKMGVKISFVIGSSLIMLSSLFLAFVASQPWHYLVALGIGMGSGIAFGSVVALATTISRWFTRMRGRAMAIALTASSFAGLIFAPAINFLIQSVGLTWRQTWFIVACAMVIPIAAALLFVKEFPADIGQVPDGGEGKAPEKNRSSDALRTSYDWTPGQAYKTGVFWIIVIASCITQYPFAFFSTQWIPAMRSFNFDPQYAALGVSVFTIMSFPARLAAGALLDKIRPKFVFIAGFVCTVIAYILALAISPQTFFLAYASATFAAFGFGFSYVSYQTVTVQFYGIKAYPRLNGIVLTIASVVSAPASLVASSLFGSFGSFTPAFVLNIFIGAIGIALLFFLRMPKPPAASA